MIPKCLLIAGVTLLAACTSAGPRGPDIVKSGNAVTATRATEEKFALIEVDRTVAKRASAEIARNRGWHANQGAGPVRLGIGDTVQVSIVSTSDAGFVDFNSNAISPVSTAALPAQKIRETGRINVPPIGEVEARGKTVSDLEQELTRRLSEVLVEPSAVVQLVERQSARAYVVGQVAGTGPVALDEVNARLIDVITKAGGPTARTEDLEVALSRRGRSAAIPMDLLFRDPRYNIQVLPDDVITIQPPSTKITILGAASRNQTLEFNETDVSLVEVLGRSGGLQNRRADRLGVFLYRMLPREVVASLGVPVQDLPGETIPAVFRFDFSEPTVYFIAEEFDVQDGDMLYISNNLYEEIDALTSLFRSVVVSPVNSAQSIID
ncbi:MAG: polysaccharide export protein [Sedimentitalea sp.]|nr:polysaccharide export protein [Sedimentitalea sp.]